MVAMRQRKIKQKIINDFLAYLLRLLNAIVCQYKAPADDENGSPMTEKASFISRESAHESEYPEKSSESKHPSFRSVASLVTFTSKLNKACQSSNIGDCKPLSFKCHGHKGDLVSARV